VGNQYQHLSTKAAVVKVLSFACQTVPGQGLPALRNPFVKRYVPSIRIPAD